MGNYGLQKINYGQALENVEADRRRDQEWDRKQTLWDRQDEQYKRQQELQRRQDEQYEYEKFRRNFLSNYGNTYNRLLQGQATDEEKTKMLRWLKMDDSIMPVNDKDAVTAAPVGVGKPQKGKNRFYSLTGDHYFKFDNDRDMAGAIKGLLQSKDAWTQENSQIYQEWTTPVWHVDDEGQLVKMSKAESKQLRDQGQKIVPWKQFEKQETLYKYKRGNRKYRLTDENRLVPDENGKTVSEWGDILNVEEAGVGLKTARLKQQKQGLDINTLKKKADVARVHFKESVKALTGMGLDEDIVTLFNTMAGKIRKGQEPSARESESAIATLQDLMIDQTVAASVRHQAQEALKSLNDYNFYVRQMTSDSPVRSVPDLPFRLGGPELPTSEQEEASLMSPFWQGRRTALPLQSELYTPIPTLPDKLRRPDVRLTPEEEAVDLKRDPLWVGYRYPTQGQGLNPAQTGRQTPAPPPDYTYSGGALHPTSPANQDQALSRGLPYTDALNLLAPPTVH